MNLDVFIKARRSALALSLDAVAKRAGMSKAAVHDLERGASCNPQAASIAGLGKALRVKPEKILAAAIESLSEKL